MENIINFNDFAGGALVEQVNKELGIVLENIADPNTEWKPKRKLVLTLSFQSDEERELSVVDIKTRSTLAPQRALSTKIMIDRDLKTGKIVGAEYKKQVPGQMIMEVDGEIDTVRAESSKSSDLKVVR